MVLTVAVNGWQDGRKAIDMLIMPDQVPTAEEVLAQHGYRLAAAKMSLAGGR